MSVNPDHQTPPRTTTTRTMIGCSRAAIRMPDATHTTPHTHQGKDGANPPHAAIPNNEKTPSHQKQSRHTITTPASPTLQNSARTPMTSDA
ncbi:hypothetical protein EMPG_11806 [Blastomyces silverae]|uniref:Uncharacterized protein n=1 Tax=Blastomyces silverae TaxID=2060906 RepID=A0A0H1BQ66_9EURO|nr:hypothetical protein EMPG_11806 [Blastomyces silverae]